MTQTYRSSPTRGRTTASTGTDNTGRIALNITLNLHLVFVSLSFDFCAMDISIILKVLTHWQTKALFLTISFGLQRLEHVFYRQHTSNEAKTLVLLVIGLGIVCCIIKMYKTQPSRQPRQHCLCHHCNPQVDNITWYNMMQIRFVMHNFRLVQF